MNARRGPRLATISFCAVIAALSVMSDAQAMGTASISVPGANEFQAARNQNPVGVYVLLNRNKDQLSLASISGAPPSAVDKDHQELLFFMRVGSQWWVRPNFGSAFRPNPQGDYACDTQARTSYNPCDSGLTRSPTATKILSAFVNAAATVGTLGQNVAKKEYAYEVVVDKDRVLRAISDLDVLAAVSTEYDSSVAQHVAEVQMRRQSEAEALQRAASDRRTQSELQAQADAEAPRDPEGRKIVRGPLTGGFFSGVHVVSDSVGIRGPNVSVVNSTIEAPVCIETEGINTSIMNNSLRCQLGVRYTGTTLINNKLVGNSCSAACTNRPDVFGQ